jgi:hypothetical protein
MKHDTYKAQRPHSLAHSFRIFLQCCHSPSPKDMTCLRYYYKLRAAHPEPPITTQDLRHEVVGSWNLLGKVVRFETIA